MYLYNIDNKLILQIGIGLIGKSFQSLTLSNCSSAKEFPINWHSSDDVLKTISTCIQFINSQNKYYEFYLVWTAGKAGFTSQTDETKEELSLFKSIMNQFSNELKSDFTSKTVLMLSSAGGLYEAQKNIGYDSIPKPLRPYGHLKLAQENHLKSNSDNWDKLIIIRPSSIFSSSNTRGRKGLINTLVQNVLTNRVTNIYGDPTTLRDYVDVEDVAELIFACINNQVNKSDQKLQEYIVASGKPVSIHEIIHLIEARLNSPLRIRFTPVKLNTGDITYNPNKIIRGKKSQEFEFLIQKLLMN